MLQFFLVTFNLEFMNKNPKYLSLFSGLGGLDYGLERAGFDNIGCIESDSDACKHLRLNRNWKVYETDITLLNPNQILKDSKLKKGELDLIVGGPPCQSYSKSSFWSDTVKRGYSDKRGKLIDHYMKYVEELLPKAFLIENVPGFISPSQNSGMQSIHRFLKRIKKEQNIDYKISFKILNCAEYGVPQKRERLFLVANRSGIDFKIPDGRFEEPSTDFVKKGLKLPFRTVGDAFNNLDERNGDLLSLSGKWADLLPFVPPGKNYQYFTEKGAGKKLFKYRSRYWTFLLKLHPQEPSWTIQASPGSSTGPFHWKNRKLSIRELARLQTIPDDVSITSSRTVAHKLIGNAVPSLMGEIFGQEIKKQLFNLRSKTKYSLTPDLTEKVIRSSYQKSAPCNFIPV